MATAQYITLKLPLTLRLRLAAARLLAEVGPDSEKHAESERRLMAITRDQGNLIASICLSFANSKDEFEDLRQDTLLNIWRGLGNFHEESRISTWVYRITLNTCISAQRKSRNSLRQTEAQTEFYRGLFEDSSSEEVERYELMYRMIAMLPPLDKSALLMWLDDKPYDEIAEVMGLSRNAVGARLKRAKDRLASMATNLKSNAF